MLRINNGFSYLVFGALLSLAITAQNLLVVAEAGANDGTCETTGGASCSGLMNSAFVFIKPHANTPQTQDLVKQSLTNAGITILSELEISGETIDKKKLLSDVKMQAAFRAFDKDGSNSISTEEIRKILGVGVNVTEEVWSQILSEVDGNGDGNIDYDEFKTMMLKLLSNT